MLRLLGLTMLVATSSLTPAADPRVKYSGDKGPGSGKRIVLISGDEEYRSEETLPQVTEHYHSLSRGATDKVAIISVEGAILDGEGFIKKQIDHVQDDQHVKAVVLRVNSPGGTVTASDYLYHHLRAMMAVRARSMVSRNLRSSRFKFMASGVATSDKATFQAW